MAARSLFEHITADEAIARFSVQAQRLMRYQRSLNAVMPPQLKPYARVANFRAGKLVIHAANAAVATKIRQLAPRLAEHFASDAAHVTEIDVRVQAGLYEEMELQQPPRGEPRPLPGTVQQKALQDLAGGMCEEDALRQPLLRLLAAIRKR
jgi:hypothetical protein